MLAHNSIASAVATRISNLEAETLDIESYKIHVGNGDHLVQLQLFHQLHCLVCMLYLVHALFQLLTENWNSHAPPQYGTALAEMEYLRACNTTMLALPALFR